MTARAVIAIGVGLGLGLAGCHEAPAPVVPAAKAAPVVPPKPEKIVQLNAPGVPVDVVAALPAGYVTVVDFWAESCAACVVYGDKLTAGVAGDARVVIRKVDMGDGLGPLAETYNIAALPRFLIYDKRKRLRYDLVGGDCEKASEYAIALAAE